METIKSAERHKLPPIRSSFLLGNGIVGIRGQNSRISIRSAGRTFRTSRSHRTCREASIFRQLPATEETANNNRDEAVSVVTREMWRFTK